MDKKYKVVKQTQSSDQCLCGFYVSEQAAFAAIPEICRGWRNSKREEFHVKKVDPRFIINPVNTDYDHYIWSLIPYEDRERVMKSDASAEIDANCVTCNSKRYYYLSEMIWKEWNVIDIGCSYNAESYLFANHRCFIGVNPDSRYDDNRWHFEHFKAEGTMYYDMTGQEFIRDVLPCLGLDLEKTFAICHFVPDDDCMKMVRETFPNCFVLYPK